ncbi:MAG: hypothetical protein IPF53_14505 [Blastocatellia bacterium]|nr:hypothetical protein [Blastocatellia bacterium]
MVQIQVLDVLPRVRLSRVARMRLLAMILAFGVLLAPVPARAITPPAAPKPSATRLQPKASDIRAATAASKTGTVIALPATVGGPRGGPRADDPLSAEQRAAIDALLKKRDDGKVFAQEEQHLLRRYEKGRRLSRLDADTLISRVLYYTYVDAEPMESSRDLAAAKDLLDRYTARVARKGRTIEDERVRGGQAPATSGGPDAFGYTFIDSTEPGARRSATSTSPRPRTISVPVTTRRSRSTSAALVSVSTRPMGADRTRSFASQRTATSQRI